MDPLHMRPKAGLSFLKVIVVSCVYTCPLQLLCNEQFQGFLGKLVIRRGKKTSTPDWAVCIDLKDGSVHFVCSIIMLLYSSVPYVFNCRNTCFSIKVLRSQALLNIFSHVTWCRFLEWRHAPPRLSVWLCLFEYGRGRGRTTHTLQNQL